MPNTGGVMSERSEENIKEMVLRELANIAPEASLDALAPDIRFRDQFDFDSIDCLNLISALEKNFGITIPEMDFPKLTTLNGCIHYLRG